MRDKVRIKNADTCCNYKSSCRGELTPQYFFLYHFLGKIKLSIIFMKLVKQVTNINDYGFYFLFLTWILVEYFFHLLLFGLILLLFGLFLLFVCFFFFFKVLNIIFGRAKIIFVESRFLDSQVSVFNIYIYIYIYIYSREYAKPPLLTTLHSSLLIYKIK